MSADHYAGVADGWDTAASRVYGPLAEALIERLPGPLSGRTILDAGAGTGCATAALQARGATVVAADRSHDMLARGRERRPPAFVCDIRQLAVADDGVDAAAAAFVLSHLDDPGAALAELGRAVRSGGAIVADAFSNDGRSAALGRIDDTAVAHGFQAPNWYVELEEQLAPAVGTPAALCQFAREAGLVNAEVVEEAVDVDVSSPRDMVGYRLSMPQFAQWMATISPTQRSALRRDAVEAAAEVMTPYRPIVLFLRAVAP